MKGAVATGHPLTAMAATEMLSAGGNAFDAAVAAGFASVVAEPSLTSLGGGGFMLAHIEEKEDILFDFFVNTPGLGNNEKIKPVMTPANIVFPECSQVFHIGLGSVAVPGMLKGLLHIHRRLCTLPIKTILVPALSYLKEGVETIGPQDIFLDLLKPIFTSTDYGKKIHTINGQYIKLHDKIFNPLLKDFYEEIAENRCNIYSGKTAQKLVEAMKEHNGMVTLEDLAAYEVIERKPLRIKYRDREILTNPPPASGGIMLALSMHFLENIDLSRHPRNSEEILITLVELMKEMQPSRILKNGNHITYPFLNDVTAPLIESFKKSVSKKTFISTQGTTQISVVDEKGNAASMTTSNGSGSGCYIPGTGIMLNNMMGEDDLHPDGFFSSPPNIRVSSMMTPTITLKNGRVSTVLGSGGSKRIKTAILQVLINIIDFEYSLKDAAESPRVHFEDGVVHAEPGIPAGTIEKLRKHYKVHQWDKKNMYFGGVHCVNTEMEGWGDSRRGGSFLIE
ncbi:acylase ACY 1 [bacterium BMS3Bbin09]|nr:acylase ACY 1 [bacterium BMS3Bbin09]